MLYFIDLFTLAIRLANRNNPLSQIAHRLVSVEKNVTVKICPRYLMKHSNCYYRISKRRSKAKVITSRLFVNTIQA